MALDPELLELLACPVCKSALEYRPIPTPEALRCAGCRKVYPVEDAVPVLLADAGRREPA